MVNKYNLAKNHYKNKQYKKAYTTFLSLAESGDLNSQISVAAMLYHGDGIDIDKDRAYYWYKIAAEQNNPEALYCYGMYCLEDIGKTDEGKRYFEKAVELDYVSVIATLAYYHHYGDHDYEQDKNKAILLYQKACLLKDSQSCLNLYALMEEENRKSEFHQFIKEDLGYFKYLRIVVKDNWRAFFHWKAYFNCLFKKS